MSAWPRYPTLYEINTWVWLSELRVKTGRPVDLGSVPEAEWDAIARFGFDAIWFMGVWERSPAGIAIANRNKKPAQRFPSGAASYDRDGDEVAMSGLNVELGAWSYCFFRYGRAGKR